MKLNQLVLLAGLSLFTLLTACQKEDVLPKQTEKPTSGPKPGEGSPTQPPSTEQPPATTPPVTLNSHLTQMGTKVLKYDGQDRLVEVSYTDLTYLGYTVVYEGNKPVRLNYKTGNNYLIYTYEGDKVVEAVRYYGDHLVNYRYRFEYQGDKLVKRTEMNYFRTDEGKLGITQYAYDPQGNLRELVVTWSISSREADLGRPSVIKWGNYDSKPNPLPFAESDLYLPGVKLFQNNPGFRDAGQGKELYSYTYHESGLPQQRFDKLEAYPYVAALLTRYFYE